MEPRSLQRNITQSAAIIPSTLLLVLLTAAPSQAEEAAVTWQDPVRIASGSAVVGPWRMNESDFRYVDDPAVDINDSEGIGLAWVNQSRQDIFFQRIEPDGERQKVVNVSRSPDIFSWLPRIAMTGGDPGRIYILWQEIVFSGGTHGGEAFFAYSTDGGRSFSPPFNLSISTAGDGKGRLTEKYWHNGSLDLAIGPEGNVYAAWTEYEGKLWLRRSEDKGASFSEPLHVAGNDKTPARGPALATGPDGGVHLAWTVGEDDQADIHIATSGDHGKSFSKPRRVNQGNGHADAPKLAVDGNNTVHLVYGESPDGLLDHYRILYARSRDDGRNYTAPAILSSTNHSVNFPYLALDGKDRLYVAWERFPRGAKTRPQGLGFTVSTDGGKTFTEPAVLPGTGDPEPGINGSLQGLLMRKLAVNDNGDIAVANSTFRSNDASHIWLIRGRYREAEQ